MARKSKPSDDKLKTWKAIARYLGISESAAHRWAEQGMPVRKEGRFTVADREELRRWLGRESHMPEAAHIATPETDVSAALKASITAMRRSKRGRKP
jgi:phage terminase Nu1 subunit (DNA packaging protein)